MSITSDWPTDRPNALVPSANPRFLQNMVSPWQIERNFCAAMHFLKQIKYDEKNLFNYDLMEQNSSNACAIYY